MEYETKSHCKYLIALHLILVVKYRKQLLKGDVGDFVKQKITEIAERSEFNIEEIEVDKDHIHILLTISPNISVASYVRRIKQSTTQSLWSRFKWFKKQFWVKKTFWSDGYFVCSVGNGLLIQFKNTFKSRANYSDSSHRHRFASINGFSRKISIKSVSKDLLSRIHSNKTLGNLVANMNRATSLNVLSDHFCLNIA